MRLLGILDGLRQDVYFQKTYAAKQVAAAPVGSFTFDSIPSDYQHLRFSIVARSAGVTGSSDLLKLRFNNDAVTNNYSQYVRGAAAAASAGETIGGTSIECGVLPNDGIADASFWGVFEIVILNYASTFLYKHWFAEMFTAYGNTTGLLDRRAYGGYWPSTSAISRVDFFVGGGNNFKTNSTMTLQAHKF